MSLSDQTSIQDIDIAERAKIEMQKKLEREFIENIEFKRKNDKGYSEYIF